MVMNNKKSVFGVVEKQEKNEDYTGIKTETAEVTVDNVNREISVDVDFRSMLGETNSTAYPGIQGKINRELILKLEDNIEDEINRSSQEDEQLSALIRALDNATKIADIEITQKLNRIDSTYASKEYVNNQLVEFNRLNKKIVDSVSVEDNTVTFEGVVEPALDNTIYLVIDSLSGEESYNQYLIIDKQLTFIGTTKIDLSNYATIAYVDSEISSIDLSDYAKLSDIPDVSEFIDEIPAEYITESELEEKQYLTKETAQSDFATKVYVQTELAKIGTFSKLIVESIDIENNKVVIDGATVNPEDNIIYLVKRLDEDVYDQYTLVNNILTFIGSTDVDLKGYATVDYVEERAEQTLSEVEKILTQIEFIDGGTSSSL